MNYKRAETVIFGGLTLFFITTVLYDKGAWVTASLLITCCNLYVIHTEATPNKLHVQAKKKLEEDAEDQRLMGNESDNA
jgi:hypothetical protein